MESWSVSIIACSHSPHNDQIPRASQKYRWTLWVVYDQNFRQEAMNNPSKSWTKVEPMPTALQGKQLALKLGVFMVNALTMQPTAACKHA